MKRITLFLLCSLCLTAARANTNDSMIEIFKTSKGEIKLHLIKHATFYIEYQGKIIHVDPLTEYADYSKMPKADYIIVTHDHSDHLDIKAIKACEKKQTQLITNKSTADILNKESLLSTIHVMANDDHLSMDGIVYSAVPAYNTTQTQFHPKGRDNGFILTIDGFKMWIPGDCEDMPELKTFPKLDLALIPVNQPYTMTIDQAVNAVKILAPKVVLPIHLGDTDTKALQEALTKISGVTVLMHAM